MNHYNIYRGEYIWIDGFGGLRSKTKIERIPQNETIPLYSIFGQWNYDGSSTGQATTESSEVHLKPVKIVPDVTRCSKYINSYLVLCETYCDIDLKQPHPTNTRAIAEPILRKYADEKPMFGIEQEFFLFKKDSSIPLVTSRQGECKHYCSVGAGRVSSRPLLEAVVAECLAMGFNITGMNYEVAPGQAEIQICEEGIDAADNLVLLRYVLARAAEQEDLRLDISAKPIKGDCNGSGCHTNFSTEKMRYPGGYQIIMEAISKLALKHNEHIACYGNDNADRLTGKHETSSMDKFSYGIANRGASVRIPTQVARDLMGYFEDRRPSASMDPYLVTSKIVETVCS
jgi:glutamine synthetase